MFPSVTIWVLWNGLSSLSPSPLTDAMPKESSHAVINEFINALPSLIRLHSPSVSIGHFSGSVSRSPALPVPPVCHSSAWGGRVPPTPALPQRGLLPLPSSLWHCWPCDSFRFVFPLLCVTCLWFLLFSPVHAVRVHSQRCVELLPSSQQPSPSSLGFHRCEESLALGLSPLRHFLFKPGGTSPLFCTTSPGYPLTSSTVYSPPPRPLPRSTFSRPAFNLKKPYKYCNWKCAALSAIVISVTLVILLAYFIGKLISDFFNFFFLFSAFLSFL